jgi:type II pantothenate kinase
MSHFRLLSDPENYVAIDWDLLKDERARVHWLDHFEKHFVLTLEHAHGWYGRPAGRRIDAARAEFQAAIDKLRARPDSLPSGKLNIIELDRLRGQALRKHGIEDPFAAVKARENEAAMAIYPQTVRDLHLMERPQRWLHLVECVFAGNIFDLGAMETMDLAEETSSFVQLAERIKPRPWLVDDFDALAAQLIPAPPMPWAKAVVFVDNAGSDFVLGVMPLVREMALGGTQIVLAANETPSLNDITVDEVIHVVERLAVLDSDLAALIEGKMFEVVSTGSGIPLIDLSEVSDELNAAAEDADCVILEGMGRAVESNPDAKFSVDCIRLAILKDAMVAKRIGGGLYDCLCKFTPAAPPAE